MHRSGSETRHLTDAEKQIDADEQTHKQTNTNTDEQKTHRQTSRVKEKLVYCM